MKFTTDLNTLVTNLRSLAKKPCKKVTLCKNSFWPELLNPKRYMANPKL